MSQPNSLRFADSYISFLRTKRGEDVSHDMAVNLNLSTSRGQEGDATPEPTSGGSSAPASVSNGTHQVPKDPQGFTYGDDLFTTSGTQTPEEQHGVATQVSVPETVELGTNPADGGADHGEIERFLTELYAGAPGLLQTVRADGAGVKKTLIPRFHGTDEDGIEEAVTRLLNGSKMPHGTGLYAQVTTCAENPNAADDQPEFGVFGTKRGGVANTSHLLCLWNDIDFGEDGHAEAKAGRLPNPPDAATAHEIYVRSGLPGASIIVNSGGGLYELVLLDEPYDLRDPAVRRRVESVSKRWQQLLEKTAREMGYHYGAGVSNLDRILRVPGTVNSKVWDRLRRATAQYTGVRYSFAELEEAINALHPEPVAPARPDGAACQVDRWSGAGNELPGNDFNARGDWQRDILGPAGMTYSHSCGEITYWCRPGKEPRDGHGFSLNHKPDLLFAWTDGTALTPQRYYDKFSAFARLFHGGDFKAAAQALRTMGYGTAHSPVREGQTVTASAEIPAPRSGASDTVEAVETEEQEQEGGEKESRIWGEPIPLEEPAPAPYDLTILGDLGEYTQCAADAIAVPHGMALMMNIGAVSAAIGGRRTVKIRHKWSEPVVLHTLALAPPGSRKSAAQNQAFAPVLAEEDKRRYAETAEVLLDQTRRALLEDRIKEARKKAASGKTDKDRLEGEADLEALVIQKAQIGTERQPLRMTAADITPEELANLMARQGERMCITESEASFLANVSGQYSQGGRPKLDLVLSAYDHQKVTVDRVSKEEPVILHHPSLTIAIAVQGDSITGLGKSCAEMDKKGAWGRFLYDVSPNHTARARYTPEIPQEIEDAHHDRIKALMEKCYDDEEVREMTLTPEAADIFFDEYYVPGDPNLKADHYRVRIKGWDDKQPGRVVRLAALIALYEDPEAKEVGADAMRRVIALDETMTAHAHRASGFMTLTANDPLAPARDVLDWIEGQMFTREVRASQVQAAMRKQRRPWCVRLDDTLDALTVLEEYGHITFPFIGRNGDPEKRVFLVHPKYMGEGAETVEGAGDEVPEPTLMPEGAALDAEDQEKAETDEERLLREAALKLTAFGAEFCRTGSHNEHWVPTQELLDAFSSYVGDDGWLDARRMGLIVKRVFSESKRAKKRINGELTPVYRGISIIPVS